MFFFSKPFLTLFDIYFYVNPMCVKLYKLPLLNYCLKLINKVTPSRLCVSPSLCPRMKDV